MRVAQVESCWLHNTTKPSNSSPNHDHTHPPCLQTSKICLPFHSFVHQRKGLLLWKSQWRNGTRLKTGFQTSAPMSSMNLMIEIKLLYYCIVTNKLLSSSRHPLTSTTHQKCWSMCMPYDLIFQIFTLKQTLSVSHWQLLCSSCRLIPDTQWHLSSLHSSLIVSSQTISHSSVNNAGAGAHDMKLVTWQQWVWQNILIIDHWWSCTIAILINSQLSLFSPLILCTSCFHIPAHISDWEFSCLCLP